MRGALLGCAAGFAFSANYTNHAPVAPVLMAEFHFSQASAGLLTTGIFLTHAAMQIPCGHLADRFGATRVLAWALAVVCAGNLGIALASGYGQLLFWKVFAGFGTGTCFVAGARYIAGLYKGRELHTAQGLYGGSILLGSGFVIFAVPQFLAAFGWRGAFVATGTVALAVWLLWVLWAPLSHGVAHAPGSFAGMLRNPQLWLLGVIQMASFGLVVVMGSWLVMFLSGSLGMTPAAAGRTGSLVLLLGILTRPLGGALVPRLGTRRLLPASMAMTTAGCLLLGAGVDSAVVVAILLVGTGCGLPYAALFNRAAGLYPGRAGAAMGLVNMLGIGMILLGAPLVGHMADWTGSFRASFLALGGFAAAAAVASLAAKEK